MALKRLFYWLRLPLLVLLLSTVSVAAIAEPQAGEASSPSSEQTSYAALADLLENEQTRNEMISQLRHIAQGEAPSPETSETAAGVPVQEQSLGGRIADMTQNFAQGIAEDVTNAIASFRSAGDGEGAGLPWSLWGGILLAFGIAVVSTVVAFFVLRALVARIYRRIDQWVASQPVPAAAQPVEAGNEEEQEILSEKEQKQAAGALLRRWSAVLGALLIDVIVIVLAGAAGYLVSLFGAGETGEIGRTESLFINAFVIVEIVKALIRMVFSTRYDSLRLFAMSSDTASYWNRWLARVVGITGYGLMVAVPMINAMLSPAAGQMVSLLIMIGVYIYAVRVVLKNRITLRDNLNKRADESNFAFFSTLLRILGRTWHLFALAYFTVLLVVSQVQPAQALPFMAHATVQTLLAVGIGILISSVLTIALARRIHLSENLRERLPMLEERVNSYVPKALRGLRILLGIFVILTVLDAWHAFDLPGWLSSESGAETIGMIVHVAIILFISTLIWTVVASFIEHRLSAASAPSAREKTLLSLFRNAILILIVTMTVLIVLSQIGINIGPLIAGAGVVGLAIGFGAQKLVQDIITGVFIQLENAMNTGDVVGVAGLTGTAEKITIRSVGLRTLDGTFHVIPFSSVDTVSNYMRDFAYHVGEYGIAYRENVDNAILHLREAFAELMSNPDQAVNVIDDMAVPGVVSLADSSVNIRIMIKTKPGTQWGVGREFNRLVKKHFDAAGIEIPYPHTTLYFGQDKNGGAPPANVHVLDEYVVEEGQAGAAGQTPSRKGAKAVSTGQAEHSRLQEKEKLPDEDNDEGDDGNDVDR
ncbi:mechanosensitive channel protein [Kushneria pakistanensis]|uniref:Mechanosensitive channel protein n=1 Tax=Kushneria pakistanensis TaxID=1508770 RepID=A0ABQ3F957_9GAMM|nr:mechanosensitive ion channel domain-containing protein [Kushneria pakistanensis]GHC14507.1 mechanosensitive channel protein [Kushneria pakistanensis]